MIKKLPLFLLLVSLLVSLPIHSQNKNMNKRSGSLDFVNNLTGFEMIKDHNHQTETQEFSCNYSVIKKCNHTHKHTDAVSLIDIISSDKRSDFNCSGGFCMDKSHFHKKGISPKKQLFNYFINISC